ncbi:MAG: flagellar hook capping FlgD N-terminal domain-containing protein [Actinomycetota bacterium]
MTVIDPFSDVRAPAPNTPPVPKSPDDQFGKDTFLKLLVAQLRFQNPLSPTDPSEFLAQTAQFTMVEKLEEIEQRSAESLRANETVAAAALIGRTVTFGIGTNEAPIPAATTRMSLGGNLPADAATAALFETNTSVFTKNGNAVPLRLQFSRLPDPGEGTEWELRVFQGSQQLGDPKVVAFGANGERTSPDALIPAIDLDGIVGTAGLWPPAGTTLAMGSPLDSHRVRVGAGSSTFTVREQNGSDGRTFNGIVIGMRFDPTLGTVVRVGDREVPLASITEVKASEI